jgi:hypothetical protein
MKVAGFSKKAARLMGYIAGKSSQQKSATWLQSPQLDAVCLMAYASAMSISPFVFNVFVNLMRSVMQFGRIAAAASTAGRGRAGGVSRTGHWLPYRCVDANADLGLKRLKHLGSIFQKKAPRLAAIHP